MGLGDLPAQGQADTRPVGLGREKRHEQVGGIRQAFPLVVHRELGPAGITGLNEFSPRDLRCMVGTWLGRRFWGTGANRESKALVAYLAFEVLGMHRLGSYSNPANVRSTKALLGVGFTQEGVLRHWHRHGDEYYDVNVFGMLRSDWASGPLAGVPVAVEGHAPEAFVATTAR